MTRQHKSKEGEERKITGIINCEFWCVKNEWGELTFYRESS